ncbi:exoribonuclease R [Vibrio splendidus]
MQRDYTLTCLNNMPREELEEFSLRMIHRLVPEDAMTELFTFEQEEVTNEERMQSAKFDAMLRMTAIALSEVNLAFSESDNSQQNIERMTRLLLWHFYAMSFNLEQAISLETHCDKVEKILLKAPTEAFGWVKELTELLHFYAEVNEGNEGNEGSEDKKDA